jgi:hypothetical protein
MEKIRRKIERLNRKVKLKLNKIDRPDYIYIGG